MPTPPLSDEVLQETIDAWLSAHRSRSNAAEVLGIAKGTVDHRLKVASRRGMLGPMKRAQDGFEVKTYSEHVDKNGNVKSRSTKYGHEAGGEYEVPEGYRIKGESVLTDGDGQIRARWVKTREDEPSPERIADIIKASFEDFKPFAPAIVRLKDHDASRLTLYPLADLHVGMFAWSRETDGLDWDLSIARRVLVETFAELVEQTPKSQEAVILGLGDLLHADSHKNQTPNSGNIMDVDTRYSKCLPTVCDIVAECCDMVRQKHKRVEVAIKAGNHDVASTVGIRQGLRSWFRNDDRVTVDDSPSPYYWRRFGVNLIAGTHGDGCKAKDLPLFMANVRAADWADAKSKHAHTGHLHNEFTFELGGVKIHQHRAPIPADAWHHAQGYRSGRSMRAFHYHHDLGARGYSEVEIL